MAGENPYDQDQIKDSSCLLRTACVVPRASRRCQEPHHNHDAPSFQHARYRSRYSWPPPGVGAVRPHRTLHHPAARTPPSQRNQ
jgi:hypothetical protein